MKSQRETIEDAIIDLVSAELLQTANPATGFLGLVGEYSGELDSRDTGVDDLLRRINGQFPAVLVEAGGGALTTRNAAKRNFNRDISIDVYVCSNNLRSRESRSRNDAAYDAATSRDPGAAMTVELLHSLIAGNDFSIAGVGPGIPQSEAPIIKSAELTVWRSTFEFPCDANVEPWDNGNGQVLTSYFLKAQLAEHPADDPPNPVATAEGIIP